MKKSFLLLLLCLALVLTGCSKSDYAIRVGDRTVTVNDYSRSMELLRSNYLATDPDAEDTKAYWTGNIEEGKTLSEAMTEAVQKHLIQSKLYAVQFDKLNLSFTAEEDQAIQSALSETVDGFGSLTAFNEYLQKSGYTYDEFLEEQYDMAKKSKVLSYYYGAEGKEPVKLQDIKDYYNVHNALIKSAIILKTDAKTGETLDKDDMEKAAQKAEDAYQAAIAPSDIDTFEDVIGVYSAYSGDTESLVVNETNTEPKILEKILALEVGEVLKYEAEDCHYIIKRYDGTADEVFTSSMQLDTLETIRAKEIQTLLDTWQQETPIKINKKITKMYRPEKMMKD